MAKFAVGKRVERNDLKPNDCGTIIKILSDGPAGASYEIDWDNHPGAGPCPEIALVPCGSRDASGDVLTVIQVHQPISDDAIADALKEKHGREAVDVALRHWEEQGVILKTEPDGLWVLTHP